MANNNRIFAIVPPTTGEGEPIALTTLTREVFPDVYALQDQMDEELVTEMAFDGWEPV